MNKVLNCLKRKTWKTNVTKLTTDDFETSTSTGISNNSSTTKHAKSTETRGRKTHRIISNFISKTLQQWSCIVCVSESYEEKESKMVKDDQISVEQPVTGVSACQSNSEQRKRLAWAQDTLWKRPKAAKGCLPHNPRRNNKNRVVQNNPILKSLTSSAAAAAVALNLTI